MAFSSFTANFFRLCGAPGSNGPTIWGYKSTDAATAVDASGYFNAVADRVKVGDLIYAYKTDATVSASLLVVLSNTRDLTASPPVSGVVDTGNATAVNTAIDSD